MTAELQAAEATWPQCAVGGAAWLSGPGWLWPCMHAAATHPTHHVVPGGLEVVGAIGDHLLGLVSSLVGACVVWVWYPHRGGCGGGVTPRLMPHRDLSGLEAVSRSPSTPPIHLPKHHYHQHTLERHRGAALRVRQQLGGRPL
jgi:hypothetical protein